VLQVASDIFETLAQDLSESVKKALVPSEKGNVERVVQHYVNVLKAVLKSAKSATVPEIASVKDKISEATLGHQLAILDISGLERVAGWLTLYRASILNPDNDIDAKTSSDLKKSLSQVASKVCKTFGKPLIVFT
jgi:hypothetical protein